MELNLLLNEDPLFKLVEVPVYIDIVKFIINSENEKKLTFLGNFGNNMVYSMNLFTYCNSKRDNKIVYLVMDLTGKKSRRK